MKCRHGKCRESHDSEGAPGVLAPAHPQSDHAQDYDEAYGEEEEAGTEVGELLEMKKRC